MPSSVSSTVISENLDLERTGAYLVSEANGYQSREQVILASGAGIVRAGTVLGKITASGKYVPYAPAANDGSQNAAGILFEARDATSADKRCVITARATEVVAAALNWGSANGTQKNAGLAALAALGILAR